MTMLVCEMCVGFIVTKYYPGAIEFWSRIFVAAPRRRSDREPENGLFIVIILVFSTEQL